ncbi:hypothetical protein CL614_01340 [archaeon]|nr:hypothetical protein [archaeon]
MEKMQKFIVRDNKEDSFIIIEDKNFSRIPFFCPICEFIMNSMDDSEFYEYYGCCASCGMKFAQPRQDNWKEGWRPSKTEILSHKKFIESQPLNLFLDDDHN